MDFFKKIISFVTIIIAISACSDKKTDDLSEATLKRPTSRKLMIENNFPSTNVTTLNYIVAMDEDINCPVAARYAAMYELLEGSYMLFNDLYRDYVYVDGGQNEEIGHTNYMTEGWTLTNNPRAIYNFDGSIKYYEFGLVENGDVIATITVYAKPEAPRAIAYMFPYTLPYTNTSYDYYVGDYPHRLYHDGTGFKYVEESEQNYKDISLDTIAYWDQIYSQSTSEDIAEWETLRQNANIPDMQYTEAALAYWDSIKIALEEVASLQNLDNPCVADVRPNRNEENTYIEHLKDKLGTTAYCRDYTAAPYRNIPLQKTRWTGACGPSALAWVYRGLYNRYPPINGEYLPLNGDGDRTYFEDGTSNSFYYYNLGIYDSIPVILALPNVLNAYIARSQDVDNGLTAKFYQKCTAIHCSGSWQFALAPWKLDDVFEDATNNVYSVYGDCTALTAADWIKNTDLPFLLLETDLSHYMTVFGYGGTSDTYGGDISRSNLYFLVTDNGYEIKHNGYKPFWRHYKVCEYYHRIKQNN